jgi:protein disulfide isomerase
MQCVLLALLVAAAAASDVLVLTGDNFEEAVKTYSPFLVEFYAPWCGHCKSLEPEYEKAATALKAKGISIAKVDATQEEELASRSGVQGFPTLKVFKNGMYIQDYKGPRTAEGIISFLEKKKGSPLTTVSSNDEVKQILAQEKYGVVVGYFDDRTTEAFRLFEALADRESNIKFLVFSDAGAASSCFLSEVQLDDNIALTQGSIVVLGADGSKRLFNGDVELGLVPFFYESVFPQSTDLEPELFQKLLETTTVILTAFDFNSENAAAIRKLAVDAAATQPSLRQMFADTNKWMQPLVRMGVISGNVFPTSIAFLAGFDNSNPPISWDEEKTFNAETFTAWLADVVAGNAVTWKKSEPIPASNDGPVKVVVQKNFDSIVLDQTKDVLLEFYAPWCGHCKNLEPTYTSLGEHFANDANVVIAKIDATANFVNPAFGVRGFPSIIFFPAGDKSDPIKYEGTRTFDDLLEFVNANRNSK